MESSMWLKEGGTLVTSSLCSNATAQDLVLVSEISWAELSNSINQLLKHSRLVVPKLVATAHTGCN